MKHDLSRKIRVVEILRSVGATEEEIKELRAAGVVDVVAGWKEFMRTKVIVFRLENRRAYIVEVNDWRLPMSRRATNLFTDAIAPCIMLNSLPLEK